MRLLFGEKKKCEKEKKKRLKSKMTINKNKNIFFRLGIYDDDFSLLRYLNFIKKLEGEKNTFNEERREETKN